MTRVALLALTITGCSTLLGVDGTYDVGGDGGGPGTSTSSSPSTSDATITSTGPGGGEGGAAGQGAGGAGAAPGGGGGAGPSTTGTGGSEPIGPGTCARCKVGSPRSRPDVVAPRLAHRSDRFWMTFLGASTAYLMDGPDDADPIDLEADAPDTAFPTDDPTFTGPHVYLVEQDVLRRNDRVNPSYSPIAGPFVTGVRGVGGHPLVAASIEDGRPALLECNETPCTESTYQTCSAPTASAGRGVDLDRNHEGTLTQFARLCGDDILVSLPDQTPDLAIPADGADEVAFALGEDWRYVLAVRGSGTSDASVVVYRETEPILIRAIDRARSPDMVAIDGESALGVVVGDGGLVMIECVDATCTVGHLDAEDVEGAGSPSLGVFRAGDGPPDPWIAWEVVGGIRWGRLSAADPAG